MHRDARPCRWWRPYGSPPYSFKSLKFGQFWVSVWGQGPPMRKVLSIWLQYPADENLPQFGPTWPTMTQIKNQRLAWKRCRNPVLSFTQFFSFHLIENADRLLWGGKPKSKGEHNLIAVSTEKGTHRGSILFGENTTSRGESQCCECRLLFLGLKRTELLMCWVIIWTFEWFGQFQFFGQ